MQEDKVSSNSSFITLTYDTKTVPISHNGFMSLNKRDVQLFFKRLRKKVGSGIKYYAVGEYGTKGSRPHYHVILFNCPIAEIQKAWGNGQVHYGFVSGASIGYTLKYMSKPAWRPWHKNDDREPQFSLMSKGLGANYLSDAMVNWHHADMGKRMYCNIEDGKKISMPRYYKEKVYTKAQQCAVGIIAKRDMDERKSKDIADGGDEYFRDKAEAHKAAFKRMEWKAFQNESF